MLCSLKWLSPFQCFKLKVKTSELLEMTWQKCDITILSTLYGLCLFGFVYFLKLRTALKLLSTFLLFGKKKKLDSEWSLSPSCSVSVCSYNSTMESGLLSTTNKTRHIITFSFYVIFNWLEIYAFSQKAPKSGFFENHSNKSFSVRKKSSALSLGIFVLPKVRSRAMCRDWLEN